MTEYVEDESPRLRELFIQMDLNLYRLKQASDVLENFNIALLDEAKRAAFYALFDEVLGVLSQIDDIHKSLRDLQTRGATELRSKVDDVRSAGAELYSRLGDFISQF